MAVGGAMYDQKFAMYRERVAHHQRVVCGIENNIVAEDLRHFQDVEVQPATSSRSPAGGPTSSACIAGQQQSRTL